MIIKRYYLESISNQLIIDKILKHYHEESLDVYDDIHNIVSSMKRSGFDFDFYMNHMGNESNTRAYVLFEGQDEYPFVLELFIWPSKQYEGLKQSINSSFETDIHSHPFKCAFSVVSGAITELIYELDGDVCKYKKRLCHNVGEGTIDHINGKTPYIHHLCFEGGNELIYSKTLHIYGVRYSKDICSMYTADQFYEVE